MTLLAAIDFAGFGWLLLGICATALPAAAAWAAWARSSRRERAVAERHFEAFCRADAATLAAEAVPANIPGLPAGNPWHKTATLLRETLQRHCRRTQELEIARTALEIRTSRAVAEARRLNAIFAGFSDPVIAVDEYGELALANRSAAELFGLDSKQNVADRCLTRLLRSERLVQLLQSTGERHGSCTCSEELEVADASGQAQWFRVTAVKTAESDQEGQPSTPGTTVAVFHDVREQKQLQKRNAEFVSSVSHEMKTPLAGIKAYVELLVDGDAEDEKTREEFLGVINSQVDRLQRLIDNLLNLARIEAGVVQVNKQPRSVNELLSEAAGVIRPSAEAKNIQVIVDLSPMYLGVLADRDMLLQAAINLLSNAVKYTHPGGRVTIRSRLADDEVRFEVADTGVGLSPEDCEKVFEKFYRVKKDKEMASGTGLGLPLAKHIVEDVHGGRLTLESTLGAGSTFIVTLPCAGQMTKDNAAT